MSYVEKDGVRTFANGREVCATKEAWEKRRREVWLRDERRCQCKGDHKFHMGRKCNRLLAPTVKIAIETSTPVAHVHHKNGRGLGGSIRDDRPDALITECGMCHAGEHGASV